MSCRQAFEIDLAGFLENSRRPEFAGFREHYPGCSRCAAEVRVWTDLHAALQAAAPEGIAHPSPEQLLQLAERPRSLRTEDAARLDAHLSRCAPCRDEFATFGNFDFARLESPARASVPGFSLGSWFAPLGRLFWHPAFAYALVALIAIPVVRSMLRQGELPLQSVREIAAPQTESAVAPTPAPRAPHSEFRAVLEDRDDATAAVKEDAFARREAGAREETPEPIQKKVEGSRELASAQRTQRTERVRQAADAAPLRDAVSPPEALPKNDARQEVGRALEPAAALQLGESSEGKASQGSADAHKAVPGFARSMAPPEPQHRDRGAFAEKEDSAPGTLRVEVPHHLKGEAFRVRVRAADGRREIVHHFARDEYAPVLFLEIPRDWLGRDDYAIEFLTAEDR